MLKLIVWNYIKTYQSDNLFWKIFDMEDNKKQRDSLRANGAYTVPSLKLSQVMGLGKNPSAKKMLNPAARVKLK